MKKTFFSLIFSLILVFITNTQVMAAEINDDCQDTSECPVNYVCMTEAGGSKKCIFSRGTNQFENVFGKINPPQELKAFVNADPTGAGGLSLFFNNFIGLIYSAAAVIFILMILWGAWDWITSGGEKDKIQAAQRKIINAIVGILLFAVAFAVINTFGQFTGFKFFSKAP